MNKLRNSCAANRCPNYANVGEHLCRYHQERTPWVPCPTTEDRELTTDQTTPGTGRYGGSPSLPREDDALDRMIRLRLQCATTEQPIEVEEEAQRLEAEIRARLRSAAAREDDELRDVAEIVYSIAEDAATVLASRERGYELAQNILARLRSAAARATEPSEDENWLPTAENVNTLPQPVRKYIHDLETRCDPAGEVRELAIAKDIIRALEADRLPEPLERGLLCQMCGRDYPTWSADSDLWNAVMRGGVRGNADDYAFVCPTCFVLTATLLGHAHAFYLTVEAVGLPASEEALRKALEEIGAKHDLCIYGYPDIPDSDRGPYQLGSHAAFIECANIARAALRGAQETDGP